MEGINWAYFLVFIVFTVTTVYIAALMTYRRLFRRLSGNGDCSTIEQVRADWTLLATGKSSDIELEKAWLTGAQKMFNLFVRKNHDYGPQNLAMGWTRGITVRLGDKVSRLWQLTGLNRGETTAKVSDESVADSFLDAANYALVGYLMERGEWPLSNVRENIGDIALLRVVIDVFKEMSEEQRTEFLAALLSEGAALEVEVRPAVSVL